MISETWDCARIAEVANHPSVFPWICGGKDIVSFDFTADVKDRNNIFLFGEFGGFFFRNMDGRVFDAHSMVLPEGRGPWAMAAATSALNWMFERTNAHEIMMSVPKGNIAVRALVKRLGAKKRGTIPDQKPIDVYSITKEEWRCRLH